MRLSFHGQMLVKDGKMSYRKQTESVMYQQFLKNIKDGYIVDVFMEVHSDTGTLGQLARAHAMLRELSSHTGIPSDDLKLVVKQKAGLCFTKTMDGHEFLVCKSLGDVGHEDLSLFIQECMRLGEEVNCPLK